MSQFDYALKEPLLDASAQHCNNMVAGMIIETIIRLGISVTAFRIVSPNQGWGLTAHDPKTGEWWNVRTDEALDAACELATAIDLESRETAQACRLR